MPRSRRALAAFTEIVLHPKRILGIAAELRDPRASTLGEYLRKSLPTDVARAAAVQIMSHDGVVLDFERDGFRWLVDAGDEIGCSIYATGRYEGPEIDVLLEWLSGNSRGRVIVDLGANVGTTSVPFALAGYHVLAIEPVPSTYSMLTSNVGRNGLDDRIICVQAAIADVEGAVKMWTGFASGQAEIQVPGAEPAMAASSRGTGVLVSVDARRLDSVLAERAIAPGDVALVWADVQGSETAVIETGGRLWEAGVPMYLEVYPRGIRIQAGLSKFHQAVRSSFAGFLTSDDLLSRSSARPIAEFATFVESVEDSYSDALLLPRQ